MHTDTIKTFLSALHDLQQVGQLKIEGRVPSEQQRESLEKSPTYQFYMQSRLIRSAVVVPSSLGLTPESVAGLVQSGFSPSSLEEQIGYKTGYFNAGELVDRFLQRGPNALLPIIGGVNEFYIGSDNLSQEELSEISRKLFRAFEEQERGFLQAGGRSFNRSVTPGFTSYNLNILRDLIVDKNDKKITNQPGSLNKHTINKQNNKEKPINTSYNVENDKKNK